MNTLYLIRHGETASNRKGIFRGRLDIPLSPAGIRQAQELRRYFEGIAIDAVFSSPLKRALDTATIAFPSRNIQQDELLNNLDLGDWSGLDKDRVAEESPELWQTWITTPEKMTFPNGEGLDAVYRRADQFLKNIRRLDTNAVAAISHRSVTKVILAAAVGLCDDYFWKFHLDNCSVTQLIFDRTRNFTIYKLNETHFLSQTAHEWY